MRILQTEDGSFTFYNEEHQEPYHSKSGAYEESVKKYVQPTKIQNGSKILDYYFGLGYNTLAAISQFDNLYVVAIELDKNVLMSLHQISFEEPILHALYQQLSGQILQQIELGKTDFEIIIQTSTIRIIIEDVISTLPTLSSNFFDAIFFDPFSPAKQPELWSEKQFRECYRVLKHKGILATYSYARVVRDVIKTSGFLFMDGPCVGRRSPSSLGIKD